MSPALSAGIAAAAGRLQGKPVTSTSILEAIEEAKAKTKALNQELYRLAPLSVTDPAAERAYGETAEALVEAQRSTERLQQALAANEHQTRVEVSSERAATRRGQLAEFEAVLEARQAAVGDLAVAIELATEAYGEYVKLTARLGECAPEGTVLPAATVIQQFDYQMGGAVTPLGPAVAIASEMFRLALRPELRLPGAKPPSLQFLGLPEAVEPLTVTAERTTQMLRRDCARAARAG